MLRWAARQVSKEVAKGNAKLLLSCLGDSKDTAGCPVGRGEQRSFSFNEVHAKLVRCVVEQGTKLVVDNAVRTKVHVRMLAVGLLILRVKLGNVRRDEGCTMVNVIPYFKRLELANCTGSLKQLFLGLS